MRIAAALVAIGVLGLAAFAWPAQNASSVPGQYPVPGGWIKLRQRSPLSPVLIVHRGSRTMYVKLSATKAPGICSVIHWHVRWPFVTVVAQPGENHGGRFDCISDLDRSVIWVVDFTESIANPAIYAAGLDYPLGA